MATSNKKSAVLVPDLSAGAFGCCDSSGPGAGPHSGGNDFGSVYVTGMSIMLMSPPPWCTNVPRNVLSLAVVAPSAGAVHFDPSHAGDCTVVVVGCTVVVVGSMVVVVGHGLGKQIDCAADGGDPKTPSVAIVSRTIAPL